ncbi:MAG: serine/threonine protein kinase [Kofleriaceae bacterium]|nr:MAG: serine/threonine protein kinase [Kofleriaceae bacterium]MBZ0235562.1 serine/threonine protein kinase [Kofleriaceae bacterium]
MVETHTIGRYRVLSTLGAGAMGEVLRARDERLGRDVAIKRVKNVFGAMTSLFHARFEAEARALAALAHPSVVQVFDLGFEGETPYLVMELVEGPSLRDVLDKSGPLSPPSVRALGIQLARALEAAHARRILHRDIKPGNVLQGPGGIWKLADFGVARVPDSEMTVAGSFMGTPAYAAPEALIRGEYSPESDVFSLAVMLVETVLGAKPRPSGTLAEMIARAAVPVPLTGVPTDLAATLAPALAIIPTQRPSAGALAEALAGGTGSTVAPAAAAVRPGSDATIGVPDATVGVPDRTIGVPDRTVGVPDETAMTVGAIPVAPPGRKRAVWPYVVGGAAAFAAMIGIASTCSGAGEKRASTPRFEPDTLPEETDEHDEPPFDPRQPQRFDMPRDLDRRGVEEWRKVAEEVNKGKYEDAIRKIWEFEDRFGESPESARLRRFLEQMLGVRRAYD